MYNAFPGAAEMLAMEMKASGMYVSRGLSFRQAEVRTQETFIHSFICSNSFINSLIHSSIHQFIDSFNHSFVHSFIHSSIYLFIHSFVLHSFIHLFINLFIQLYHYNYIVLCKLYQIIVIIVLPSLLMLKLS